MHCCWTTPKPASDAHCACAIPANPARAQIQQTIALRHFAIWLLLFFLLVFFLLAEVLEEVFDDHVAFFVGSLRSLPPSCRLPDPSTRPWNNAASRSGPPCGIDYKS